MLDEQMAQRLIDQFAGTIECNINIMNEKGIIIASIDKTRVGSFHETAYKMVVEKKLLIEVHEAENLLGTRPGINMAIQIKNSIVGVVGITGEPNEVRPIAALLKAAVEGILEFELQQKKLNERTNSKELFFQQLLYLDEPESKELNQQARSLGYLHDCMRIPILFSVEQEDLRDELAAVCKSSSLHTKQDIMIDTRYYTYSDYKSIVEDYLEPVSEYAKAHEIMCRYYVGSLQTNLSMYHIAYQHAKWVRKHVGDENPCAFFYDYVFEYIRSRVPLIEYKGIFEVFVKNETDEFWANYVQIIDTMFRNNNNMVKSGNALHMHKNTVAYRYNQIRERLNLNPLENSVDNCFAAELCYYLMQRR